MDASLSTSTKSSGAVAVGTKYVVVGVVSMESTNNRAVVATKNACKLYYSNNKTEWTSVKVYMSILDQDLAFV